ncbi:hypothetical protein V8C43DRAFT_294415 [Trichoderma afarasin]
MSCHVMSCHVCTGKVCTQNASQSKFIPVSRRPRHWVRVAPPHGSGHVLAMHSPLPLALTAHASHPITSRQRERKRVGERH